MMYGGLPTVFVVSLSMEEGKFQWELGAMCCACVIGLFSVLVFWFPVSGRLCEDVKGDVMGDDGRDVKGDSIGVGACVSNGVCVSPLPVSMVLLVTA